MTDAIQKAREAKAWNCDEWPEWLHALVDKTCEVADRLDMSSEQAHAYAALAALDAETEVKVRELEWTKVSPGQYLSSTQIAQTMIGEYLAQRQAAYFNGVILCPANGVEAAKAAARADYERRIRSALVPPESRS